jgi:CDP-diacylglycerol---glycerol-3-phosphate 3-phosphatidyltransferase
MPWNLPNAITLARLGLLPFIVALIWPGIETRETCVWAAGLYAVGGVLDMVDGILARRRNQVTVLGKFLDPLADKLFYLVTLIALLQLQGPRVPPWLVMIFLARELAITGLRGIAATEGVVIAAGEGGKMKTTLATVGMIGLLIHYPYLVNFGPFATMIDMHRTGLWVTYISAGFAVSSAIEYFAGFSHALKGRPRASGGNAGGDSPSSTTSSGGTSSSHAAPARRSA